MNRPDPPKDATEYSVAKYRLAIDWCPQIYPCMKCKWPVIKGHCCTHCGDADPSSKEESHD